MKERRFTYNVQYKTNGIWDETTSIDVIAGSKAEAYEKAAFVYIRIKEGRCPYAAWVHSVTYSNGNHKEFNTCDGLAY